MQEIKSVLRVIKSMKLKPNFSKLAKIYGISRQTISKYYNGYSGKPKKRNKTSILDEYFIEIKEKCEIPGITVSSIYQYFRTKYGYICSESNFRKYVKNKNLPLNKIKNIAYPRFETPYGKQLQFDWKENLTLKNKNGEIFKFNVFTAVLSSSRYTSFVYSVSKTQSDVITCLISTFKKINGVTKEILTDNMTSIVNNRKISNTFRTFSRDMDFEIKLCKVRTPETKGKVESKNRFLNWLLPYDGEFETENELIDIIADIEKQANEKENATTLISPLLLFNKEKEYLKPLPDKDIINHYLELNSSHKVTKESLILYKGNKYSVSLNYINKTVFCKEIDNILYIYHSGRLIASHILCNKKINYAHHHYKEILRHKMPYKSDNSLDNMTTNNLMLLDNILGGCDEQICKSNEKTGRTET
ncbi:MAG: IS21 family transposase [Spirochaetales bacterium]|nr:IS21 family transposase [Spirochaetales bacterium]